MKTLLVLGATGVMGRRILGLARRVLPGVELLAASRGGGSVAGAAPRRIDLHDPESLATGLPGADLVVNAVGPFAYDPAPLVSACVGAGCHYADLAEAPQFTEQVARAAAAEGAGERGVLLVPGASTLPGLVQVLAGAWSGRDDVAEIRAWLSLGSRNPVGRGLLFGLLRPLGGPAPDGTRWFSGVEDRRSWDGRTLRYARYPSGFAREEIRLGARTLPIRFAVGFDRALLVRGLARAAPAFHRLSDTALRGLARAALPAARAAGRLGTPRGSLALEAWDARGERLATLEVEAQRDGLEVPAWPPLWIAARLHESRAHPTGCVSLAAVVPLADAVSRLRAAGLTVRGLP